MVKSLKSYLRLCIGFLFFGGMLGCENPSIIYKRSYSDAERLELSESLLNGAGTDLYYQGSVGERMIIYEGNKLNPENAWGMREIGVPYLKRGFAAEANTYYEKAIEYDPEEWLGYKAYCWLYFYRDYEGVLEELERFDAFTPGVVDYPQSTSVNYMKGICFLHLNREDEAIEVLSQHLEKEIKDVGHEYIDAMPYLTLAMAYHKKGAYEMADSIYSLGIKYNDTTADLYYYAAQNALKINKIPIARQYLDKTKYWFAKGSINARPYVEEFYAIYEEDIDALEQEIEFKQ